MKKSFTHLDFHARDRIEALWNSGHTQTEIAVVLGVHKSTVSREIRMRKRPSGYYRAETAEQKASVKRSNSKYQGMKIERHPTLRRRMVREMKRYRSPDEIAGRMKREQQTIRVSADAIYRWLRSSFGQRYCRYLCTKRYKKKPNAGRAKRHIIPNMVSIHDLPREAGIVTEGDTFVSPRTAGKAAAVLVGWRECKLLKGGRVKSLRPIHTKRVMRVLHREYKSNVMILDQGIENTQHEEFGVPSYFCDPASPRQKPFIESSIGLSRRWFWPKGTNLAFVSSEELIEKIEVLNNKFRKSLQYRSANEVARECGILK